MPLEPSSLLHFPPMKTALRLASLLLAFCALPPSPALRADVASAASAEFILDTRSATPSPPLLSIQRPTAFPATKLGKSSRPRTIRLDNSGGTPATGLSSRVTGKAAKDFKVAQPAVRILAPGRSTTLRATFRPRAKGVRRASVTVRAANALPASAPLRGKAR